MSYDLFWRGDFEALDFYIEKNRIEQERKTENLDTQAWLIGSYVREAVASVLDTKHRIHYSKEPKLLKHNRDKNMTQEDKTIAAYNNLKSWSDSFKKE
jgi:hypothetical protein